MDLPTLLADLADPSSTEDHDAALRQFGDEAFEPLAELVGTTSDGEVYRRARRTLCSLDVPLERYLAATRHQHANMRRESVAMFNGKQNLRYAKDLLHVLADEDYYVQRQGRWTFDSMGPDVLPLLHETRRTAKGMVRRGVLGALAEVGGPDVFSAKDRAMIERFIGVKIEDEEYCFEPMHLCGGWYAVQTDDQAAVLEVFGLSDPVPVTQVLGTAAWNNDHHAWSKPEEHVKCARVYVSAVFDGWTLVFGEPFLHAERPVPEICAVLSKVFGETHYYGMSCGDGWTAWCVAEDGEVRRYYDGFAPEKQIGEPLEVEEGMGLPHDWSDENDDLEDCWATDVAEAMSVNPSDGEFEGSIEGHGVLALTACGLRYGHPKGFLEIG